MICPVCKHWTHIQFWPLTGWGPAMGRDCSASRNLSFLPLTGSCCSLSTRGKRERWGKHRAATASSGSSPFLSSCRFGWTPNLCSAFSFQDTPMLLWCWTCHRADSVLRKDAAKWLNMASFPDVLWPTGNSHLVVCALLGGWADSLQGLNPQFSFGQINSLIK